MILANACGKLTDVEVERNDGYQVHRIEFCCATFVIEAKCISKPPPDTEGEFCYDIRSCVRE